MFQDFNKFSEEFPKLRRAKQLHTLLEERLAELLTEIYPGAHPQREPGEIPGGRADLAFYFGDGRYATFEIFVTKSQVPQDLRHLELSNAQARIAILTDPALDNGTILEEYFRKRPRDPFPWIKLSDLLIVGKEAGVKQELKKLIDKAFAQAAMLPETVIDTAIRLPHYGLEDTSDSRFGVNRLTEKLIQYRRGTTGIDIVEADTLSIFLAIPATPLRQSGGVVLQTARNLFDLNNWLDTNRPGPRYYASRIFPLANTRVRSEQNAIVIEDQVPGTSKLLFALSVNELGEIYFATSYYSSSKRTDNNLAMFRLGGIVHLLWAFLCLVREFQEGLEYSGTYHICVALTKTGGSFLGDFAKGYADPFKGNYLRGPEVFNEICQSPNLRICREEVDLRTLEPKIEPEIIYDVAEEIARAYNQPEARCFDRGTSKLPDDLWPYRY